MSRDPNFDNIRRTEKRRFERPSKVNQAIYDILRDSRNLVRNQKMKRQLKHHEISVKSRIIKRNEYKYIKNA